MMGYCGHAGFADLCYWRGVKCEYCKFYVGRSESTMKKLKKLLAQGKEKLVKRQEKLYAELKVLNFVINHSDCI